jgi:hypothetical protein
VKRRPKIASKFDICEIPCVPKEFALAILYLQDLKNRNLDIEQGLSA